MLVLFSFSVVSAQKPVGQPYSGCWHPDYIKDWTPEKDPDRKFNRSSVPLQTRIATSETMKSHAQQYPDGQIAACLTMHPMCSQVPAQGANNFVGYNPTYWQYLDVLVWWGGSAGEGIILPPSAPVIDAAHLSGVRVLGQIFFPPTAFSGLAAWTTQMNTKDSDGTYPYARKCADIAKYYGFDGWFINSETLTSTNWGAWTKDYLEYSESIGLTGQEIQLYVMSSGSSGAYIEDVAKQKGGSYMVNYGGISTSAVNNRMTSHVNNGWGDRADAFSTWYYGVEQSGSITGNGTQFSTLFPTSGHIGSINFFNPEEPIWKQTVKDLLGTSNAEGTLAYTAMNTVFSNESKFWVNSAGDVTSTSRGSCMGGLSTSIQERSSIQSKPFITTFSMGLGKHRFVNGEKKGTQDWYHRGMQTVMPTWRWYQLKGAAMAATTDLKFAYNWDDAYNVGTSVGISGTLTASTDYSVYLYKTKLEIQSGDKLQFVYKTNATGSIKIKLADNSAGSAGGLLMTAYSPSSTTTKNGWTIDEYDLTSLAGKTLVTIGLNINPGTTTAYTAQLGQLAVYPSGYSPAATQVTNLAVENDLAETVGDLRVVWDKSASTDVHHYNVYLERNNVKQLVGQTRNEGFYVPKFARNGQAEASVKVSVYAVNKNMEEAVTGQELTVNFPSIQKSVVSLKASKTLVTTNEEVTITATASNFPETFVWKTTEGATLVSSSGNTAIYKFTEEGLYPITVDVTNAVGTTNFTESDFIKVAASNTLDIVSRTTTGGKIVSVSSYMTASNESPQWLIDATTVPSSTSQKWCAGGAKEHWVILDLSRVYEIYRFMIYDCGHKENASDNLTHYRIYTSLTGNDDDWTLALDQKEVPATAAYNTKDDYIKPTLGRYVKFVPYNPEMAITIRIWQFDVYGLTVPLKPIFEDITASKKLIQTNEEVTFTAAVSENPTTYEWTVAGGTKVSQTDNKAVFTFAEEGVYDVQVTASNSVGAASYTKQKLVEVSNSVVEKIVPLKVATGFNMDGIAEGKPCADYSSGPLDDQGWVFYTEGAQAAGAIPMTDGIATSALGIPYKIQPLDGDNTLLLKSVSTGTLTFEGSYQADALYFITTSMNGMSTLKATVNYTDGTKSAEQSYSLADWCTTATGTAFGVIGRMIRAASGSYTKDQAESAKCYMYEYKINSDITKTIESVTFTKTGNNYPAIFAITAHAKVTLMSMDQPEDIIVKTKESEPVEVAYDLKGLSKEANFGITAVSANETLATVSNVVVDEAGNKVTFKVNGVAMGATAVTVTLTNGDMKITKTFNVTVELGSAIDYVALTAKVWPNPVELGHDINVEAQGAKMVRLTSLLGVTLVEKKVSGDLTRIPTSTLQRGTYILEVIGGTKIVSKVIIK